VKIIERTDRKGVGIMSEMVEHPKHYGGDTPYECIKVLKAWLTEEQYKGFLRGNALKYLCRVGKKDETVQELKKAKFYLDKLIESESQEKGV
jgi:hypothetical protein